MIIASTTNIGNIGITVTNFGTYGHGFVLWPEQPSCQYPLGSGIEHLFDGGLYVGVDDHSVVVESDLLLQLVL
ncbi:MAG: hypothetical protein U5J96_05475 [Ignavibacteriaceae bacterium]|nr:hypothetical protein [Ignavibacteriaceae bacterium]